MFKAGSLVGDIKLLLNGWTGPYRQVMGNTTAMKTQLRQVGESARQLAIPLAAAGTAIALTMRKMRQEAMHVQEAENLYVVSMGKMADATRQWSEELSDAIGMNANSIREQVATFNVMLGSMGLTEDGAASLAKEMTKLAYDMASFYNLDVQTAFDKIRSGISGEMEPLKRLGILLSETTVQQWAWRNGLVASGEQLNEQQKIIARFGSLMEQTSKAQGDMARTADSATNMQRRFSESFLEMRQELGKASAAAAGPWYGAASNAIKAVTAWAKENQNLAGTLTRVAQATGYALIGFGVLTFAMPTLIVGFKGVAAAAVVAWGAITGPVALVIAAIAAIGVAIYVIRAEFKQNLYGMKVDFKGFTDFIGKGLDLMGINFKGFFHWIGKGFHDLFNSIIGGWMGINDAINVLLKDPLDYNAALDAATAAINRDYLGEITGFLVDDFQATTMDIEAIGKATLDQLAADIAAFKKKFFASTGPTAGEAMLSWFGGGITGYENLGSEELQKFIKESQAAGGAGGKAAKAAQKQLEQLAESGRSLQRDLNPVIGTTAKLVEQIAGLKAAGLLTDESRNLLGAALWKEIADLGPAAINAILAQMEAVEPVIAAAAQRTRELQANLKLDERLIQADPVRSAMKEITDDFALFAEAARTPTTDELSVLSAYYWRQYGSMAAVELDALYMRLESLGAVGRRVVSEMMEAQMAVGELESVDNNQVRDKTDPIQAQIESIRQLGFELNQIGSTIGSDVVQKIGAAANAVSGFQSAIASAKSAFQGLKGIGENASQGVLSNVMGLTSGIFGAIGAVMSLTQAFGLFGKKGKKEISGMDRLMRGLQQALDQWIDNFADSWVEFLETGKFQFKEFVDSMMKDLARLTAKLAMQEIIGGMFGVDIGSLSAKGNVFDKTGNVVPFAKGGLITGPTFFPMPRGMIGMAGEGPSDEVVAPVMRMANGDIGVQSAPSNVTLNLGIQLVDQTSQRHTVQARERFTRDGTRQVQIVLRDALEGMAADGGLNRVLKLAGVAVQ